MDSEREVISMERVLEAVVIREVGKQEGVRWDAEYLV
ncbi:MAG: hypothetical protein ACI8WB_002713 [Phenylobacterium sp.]|jgi:hypothetical protein